MIFLINYSSVPSLVVIISRMNFVLYRNRHILSKRTENINLTRNRAASAQTLAKSACNCKISFKLACFIINVRNINLTRKCAASTQTVAASACNCKFADIGSFVKNVENIHAPFWLKLVHNSMHNCCFGWNWPVVSKRCRKHQFGKKDAV